MHDPCLAPVWSRPQSETRSRTVPQHGLASVRSSEDACACHRDLRSLRHGPIPSVRFGRGRLRWGTPRTRRVTASGSEVERVGTVVLKRCAGFKPLCLRSFQRLADTWADCDSLRPSARARHTRNNGIDRLASRRQGVIPPTHAFGSRMPRNHEPGIDQRAPACRLDRKATLRNAGAIG